MFFDGINGYKKLFSNLLVGFYIIDQLQHFKLPFGNRARRYLFILSNEGKGTF
jgi:hypothetical protein